MSNFLKTAHDAAMVEKGYRYKLCPVDSSFEPLYAKTMKSVVWFLNHYNDKKFDVINLKPWTKNRLSRVGGVIACSSQAAVDNLIQRLSKLGYNYFVRFLDSRGPAVQYAISGSIQQRYVSGW